MENVNELIKFVYTQHNSNTHAIYEIFTINENMQLDVAQGGGPTCAGPRGRP